MATIWEIMIEIGTIYTPYKTKFGVPKQGGLVKNDRSRIVLSADFSLDSVRGLQEGAFLWVLWLFHQCEGKSKELVRPPKLGGNQKIGVFATRSPFRPNNVGMSLVKLKKIASETGHVALFIEGADMVNGTPVIDIKPYHPGADFPWEKHPEPWFEVRPSRVKNVVFAEAVELAEREENLVREVLAQDPRPAYHEDFERIYSNLLEDLEICWKLKDKDTILLVEAKRLKPKKDAHDLE